MPWSWHLCSFMMPSVGSHDAKMLEMPKCQKKRCQNQKMIESRTFTSLKFLGNNVDGIRNKLESLENLLQNETPSAIFLQETKTGQAVRIKTPSCSNIHGMKCIGNKMLRREKRVEW